METPLFFVMNSAVVVDLKLGGERPLYLCSSGLLLRFSGGGPVGWNTVFNLSFELNNRIIC